MNILEQIVHSKKKELADKKALHPVRLLESSPYFSAPTVSLSKYILREDKHGIIAEFKRRSPSKPTINLYADIERISIGYMQAGASALSILTDNQFFGAKDDDLTIARTYNFCPILRKDFILDEYQIIEARSMGADAILLIAEILNKEKLKDLAEFAHSLGLEVLMEIHSIAQLEKLNTSVDLLGVNNRNLKDFSTSIQKSVEIANHIPQEFIRISESGLKSPQDLLTLREHGYNGFLIGEQFMLQPDPVKACQKMIREYSALMPNKTIVVK